MPRRPPSRRVLCHVTTGRVPDIALIIEIFASQMLNGGVKFGLFNTDLCYNFALKQWFQF